MAVATVRFREIAWEIDAIETMPPGGRRLDMAMVGMLLLLDSTLFAYLLYTVLRRLV